MPFFARSVAALLAALFVPAFAAASAPARPQSRAAAAAAARLVGVRLAAVAPLSRRVSCASRGRSGWSCRWSGSRRANGVVTRCRGRYLVWKRGARLAGRPVSRTCTPPAGSPKRTDPASPGSVGPAAAPGPAAVATRDRPFGFNDNGVHQQTVSPAADADLTQRIGASSTRLALDWRWAEPSPGQYQLDLYDDFYREMRARGIRPLFILVFAPTWANGGVCDQWVADCRNPPSPEHYDDAGRMAALLAQRYPDAAGIELWNEPNLREFWAPAPDPTAYGHLLQAVHHAVKAVAPDMPVIGASLANGEPAGFISPAQFLTGIYDAGAGASMDAIGVHPYPFSATSLTITRRTLDAVRAVRDAHGDSGRPLWVTELGATTSGVGALNENEQAGIFVAAYRALRAMPDIGGIYFHTLVEPPYPWWDPETGYGIVRADLSPKPAFCALAAERGRPGACS